MILFHVCLDIFCVNLQTKRYNVCKPQNKMSKLTAIDAGNSFQFVMSKNPNRNNENYE
jgi:hypothetical protein